MTYTIPKEKELYPKLFVDISPKYIIFGEYIIKMTRDSLTVMKIIITGKEMPEDYLGWSNTIPSVLICYQGRTLKEEDKDRECGWLKKLKVTKGSFATCKRKS